MSHHKKLYNIGHVKIPFEERDVAHRHLEDDDFLDSFAEDAEVGEEGRYAAWLTEEGAADYAAASNIRYIQEAQEIHKADAQADIEAMQRNGVEQAALEFCGFQGARLNEGTLVCVADTGLNGTDYTEPRTLEKWNFTRSDSPDDRDGHGTWCCHAALPVSGKLISAKVLGDNGSGFDSWIIAGVDKFITYCRSKGENGIVSASLGGDGGSPGYEEVAKRAIQNGVLCIAAAGNDGYTDRISYPAAYPSWLAVGAVNHRDGRIASFSNRNHPFEPNIYAPGVQVSGEGAGQWSGTSMATPIVARGAVKLIAIDGIGPVKARRALLQGAREPENYGGAGLMTLYESAEIAKGMIA